jgi:hypothetical protein
VAPGTPHQMFNRSGADLEFLVVSQPPSHGDRVLSGPNEGRRLGFAVEQGDEADEAFGGTVTRQKCRLMPAPVNVGRGHRFAAYPRCSTDTGACGVMRSAASLVVAFLSMQATAIGGGLFAEVAGEYIAGAVDERWSLTLDKTGRYVLSCQGRVLGEGKGRFVGPLIVIEAAVRDSVPWDQAWLRERPPDTRREQWPPSLQDPTTPLVSDTLPRTQLVLLTPIRWSGRLYLVRSDALSAFCGAVHEGIEPRRSAYGVEFLRSGDHRKRVGAQRPAACATVE